MEKKNDKVLKVTYVHSVIGYSKAQAKVIEALGFKKLGQTKLLPDNACIRGSLNKVRHLLRVEEE